MDYPGPHHADFRNVRSLNREYLMLCSRLAPGSAGDSPLADDLATLLSGLRPAQCERLAETPFLLFSFRERDADYWSRLLDADSHPDLFDAGSAGDDAVTRLVAAGLGFVWQLACQNPYAARLICGASMHWCERLAEKTLFEVVAVAAARPDLLVLREADHEPLWRKLLERGISSQREIRNAAHISALQLVLTTANRHDVRHAAVAACRARSLRVADEMPR